jgi:hypothetical protein
VSTGGLDLHAAATAEAAAATAHVTGTLDLRGGGDAARELACARSTTFETDTGNGNRSIRTAPR